MTKPCAEEPRVKELLFDENTFHQAGVESLTGDSRVRFSTASTSRLLTPSQFTNLVNYFHNVNFFTMSTISTMSTIFLMSIILIIFDVKFHMKRSPAF